MSTHIHMLLAAEKKAVNFQNEAKQKKQERLKQAKDEAHNEIETYTQKCEEEWLEKLRNREDPAIFEKRITEENNVKMDKMREYAESNKDKAIDMAIDLVLNIEPKIHQNFFN